jgi:DNA-binding transcriptional MerR regulator
MAAFLTIGQVSASTGETRDTIRYYERIGLVPKPMRTPAGYRQYRSGVVNRLRLIRNAQRFGFSLREIAGFLGVRDGGGKPCHDVRAAAGRMLEAVDRQIAELVDTRKRMKLTLKTWDATLAATPADRPAFLLDSLGQRGGSQLSKKSAVPGGPVTSTVTDPRSASPAIAKRRKRQQ